MPGISAVAKKAAIALPVLCALVAAIVQSPARAEDTYPSRIVKFVVAFAPGSTTDILARLVADQLSRMWSQTVAGREHQRRGRSCRHNASRECDA